MTFCRIRKAPLIEKRRSAKYFDRVKPVNYSLSLYDLELGGAFTFQGTVKIEISIKSPVKQIFLNAYQLKVNSAQIAGDGLNPQKVSEILYIEKSQRVSLEFAEAISTADGAILELQYSGVMNNDMAGFYRSRYKPEVTPAVSVPEVGEFHFMFSTQFESCDARRAFRKSMSINNRHVLCSNRASHFPTKYNNLRRTTRSSRWSAYSSEAVLTGFTSSMLR